MYGMIPRLLILSVCVLGVWMQCVYKGQQHSVGEIWYHGKSWKLQCEQNGKVRMARIIACLVPNTDVEIKVGEEQRIDRQVWKCVTRGTSGLIVFLTSEFHPDADCAEHHAKGEEWIDGKIFKLRCGDYGKTEFLGCMFEGTFIPKGGSGEAYGVQATCKFDGVTVILAPS